MCRPSAELDRRRQRDHTEREAEHQHRADHEARQPFGRARRAGPPERHEQRAHAEGPDADHRERAAPRRSVGAIPRPASSPRSRPRRGRRASLRAVGSRTGTTSTRAAASDAATVLCPLGSVLNEISGLFTRCGRWTSALNTSVVTFAPTITAPAPIARCQRPRASGDGHDRDAEERERSDRDRAQEAIRAGRGPRVLHHPARERGVVEALARGASRRTPPRARRAGTRTGPRRRSGGRRRVGVSAVGRSAWAGGVTASAHRARASRRKWSTTAGRASPVRHCPARQDADLRELVAERDLAWRGSRRS